MATRARDDLNLRPLESVPAADLAALFADERRAWRERLSWDLGDLGRALEQAARLGLVRGVAVAAGAQVVGYVAVHEAGGLARITGLHLRERAPVAAADALAGAVLDLFERGQALEGQVFGFDWQEVLDEAFRRRGVAVVPRAYLERPLTAEDASRDERPRRARSLVGTLASECGEVLVEAHAGAVEARINAAFRTLAAATSYVQEILEGTGCGSLRARASSVVREEDALLGFCLATRIAPGVAHVPQVAVRPAAQGHGVGGALLERTLARLAAEGHASVTLGVSVENERARAWYLRRGFRETVRFAAYVRP